MEALAHEPRMHSSVSQVQKGRGTKQLRLINIQQYLHGML